MIEIIEFKARHWTDLVLQEAQSFSQPLLADHEYAKFLTEGGPHYSMMVDGRVLGCAGVCMITEEHRGVAWALVAKDIGRSFYSFHKSVLNFLEESNLVRIETAVQYDFHDGHRWAQLLGFKPEGVMKKYFADGQDAILYARVR